MLLGLLALITVTASLQGTAAVSSVPMVQTDHHMGIRVYNFMVGAKELNSTAYELRVYMRAFCEDKGKRVKLRGFAGAFPVEGSEPTGLSLFSPHFQRAPELHRHTLQVLSTAGNKTINLRWLGPTNQGLWRFEGKVEPAGGEMLAFEGSLQAHQFPLDCEGSMVALGPTQHPPLPDKGLWNVVTTTSANRMPAETLAYLLVLHMQYHERLGYNGTILRCNKGEAQELSLLPHIEALVVANKLILWPWVHEHSTGHTPFYWQKPRNQLTLLAAYGSKIRMSFFDLDEYLVLPQGGTLTSSRCKGKPLLQGNVPAMSLARYSTRSCSSKDVDLDCWKDGQALPTTSGLKLVLEKCPCRFHKQIMQPDKVLTISVHFVWAWGAKIIDVPNSCGFLVHLHALVDKRGHFMPDGLKDDRILAAQWVLKGPGSGQILVSNRSNVHTHLHNITICEKWRKAAGDKEGKHFSLC